MKDLGTTSHPLTEIFTQPQSPEAWSQYALSEDQVRHFMDVGYVSGIPILNPSQIKCLQDELQTLVKPDNPGNEFFYEYHSNESTHAEQVLFHALGAWRVSPGFHDILWAPAFRMAAYQLLGSGFRLFHDQLFCKPAQHGGVVAWHQDYSYWTWTTPMAHLTCWIGLDDATVDNGCMYYVPGSHTWGLLPKTGLAGDMDAVREVLTEEQTLAFEKRRPIELKAGEATFHHPLLMHGSYDNRSTSSRRATLINVFADGVVSNREEEDDTNAPGTDKYPRVGKGEEMGGTYYPLLFNPVVELGGGLDVPTVASLK